MGQLTLPASTPIRRSKMNRKWVPVPMFRLADFHDRSLSRGKKFSRRAREERGCKVFFFSARVLASRPRSLIEIRTRLPLAGAAIRCPDD
jgi:hypothetical protein